MFNPLDASKFSHNEFIYTTEFEDVLIKVITCYQIMFNDKVDLTNNENEIRDVLVNEYINNPKIKKDLEFNYFVFPEISETRTTGRTDIRINHPNSCYNQNKEYYIIECKRLKAKNQKGATGLNAEYIKNGICRFTTNYYSSHYQVNGMIGFIVDNMDIDENVGYINNLIPSFQESNCIDALEKIKAPIKNDFEYAYSSSHVTNDEVSLKIYHLMMQVSPLIEN